MNLNKEWLGKIPENWQLKKINALYKLRNEKVSDYDYKPLSVSMKGVVPQLESTAKSDDHDNRKLVRKGDFAINSRSDRRNACGISDRDGSVSLINIVLQPKDLMNPNYYNWLFHTNQFADEFYKWGHGIVDDLWTTRWNDMKNILIPYPPLEEQKRIASWLDKKCTSIDASIDAGEKEIEKLKAYKQAIITNAVIKGLDPDVEKKDSGIEWIGYIPESWKVSRLGYESYIRARLGWRGLKAEEYVDEGYAFISAFNIQNDLMVWEPLNYITRQRYDESPEIKLHIGDVLIVKDGAGVGKSARIDSMPAGEASPNSSLGVITPYSSLNYKYCSYYLQSSIFNNFVVRLLNGMGVPHLTQEVLKNLKILLPCIDEQVQIASFLDEKCASINESIACKRAQVAALEKHKKALIFACVTGKKEVPDG